MKRLTTIALFAAAVVLAGCGKKDEKKPATTTAAPAAGTAAVAPAGGTAAVAPAGGTAAVAPAGGTAAVAPTGTDPVAPTGAAPTDAEFEAMMGKAITMFESMGKAVDAAGDDCGKLADGLNKVLDDNKDFIEGAKKVQDNAEMKKKGEEWMKGHMDQIMGPMMKVGTAGQKCATDPKFAEFQKRFDEMN